MHREERAVSAESSVPNVSSRRAPRVPPRHNEQVPPRYRPGSNQPILPPGMAPPGGMSEILDLLGESPSGLAQTSQQTLIARIFDEDYVYAAEDAQRLIQEVLKMTNKPNEVLASLRQTRNTVIKDYLQADQEPHVGQVETKTKQLIPLIIAISAVLREWDAQLERGEQNWTIQL